MQGRDNVLTDNLPDSATLYNYIGEDTDGNALYQRTYFNPCRVVLSTGAMMDNEDDNIRAYLFDLKTVAASGDTVRAYCDPRAFDTLADKSAYWTLRDDGRDWIAKGQCSDAAPPENSTAYAVRTIKRNQIGSLRMWHWKVTGR